ncbi:MAG: dihydrofolate reductase [Betaproteobacteria bacterium]|nr:dihydrofolate reductase [Betaproteobacteria bacterium]
MTSGRQRVSLIVAMAKNRVIGANQGIPWHLPGELKMFKTITMGHHMIMGRNTWESIRRLLPGRTTVIVSRQADYQVPGAIVAATLDDALAACGNDEEIFVIGGAQLYTAALPRADRIYLTEVDAEVAGDTYMPVFDLQEWRAGAVTEHAADEKNPYRFKLTVYDRAA